jgi:hypothetical protein
VPGPGGCHQRLCLICPPDSLTPAQTRALPGEYETVLPLRCDVQPERAGWLRAGRRVVDVALGLGREPFLAGHHKAFAIAGGRPCDRDHSCGRPEDWDCRVSLRPGPAGCGIDVFTTAANARWPREVVHGPGDPYHRFALVPVDWIAPSAPQVRPAMSRTDP